MLINLDLLSHFCNVMTVVLGCDWIVHAAVTRTGEYARTMIGDCLVTLRVPAGSQHGAAFKVCSSDGNTLETLEKTWMSVMSQSPESSSDDGAVKEPGN